MEVVKHLLNQLFLRYSTVELPANDTSDIDKTILRGINTFIRFVHVCIENIEIQNIQPLPANLSDWLLLVFDRNPDKICKKSIA